MEEFTTQRCILHRIQNEAVSRVLSSWSKGQVADLEVLKQITSRSSCLCLSVFTSEDSWVPWELSSVFSRSILEEYDDENLDLQTVAIDALDSLLTGLAGFGRFVSRDSVALVDN